jgi:hypothetical protein
VRTLVLSLVGAEAIAKLDGTGEFVVRTLVLSLVGAEALAKLDGT